MSEKSLIDMCNEKVENKFDLVLYATQKAIDAYYSTINKDGPDADLINRALQEINNGNFDREKIERAIAARFNGKEAVLMQNEEEREDEETKTEEITFENFIADES